MLLSYMKYLIVKCKELEDQLECDADRIPICITDDISKYKYRYGYEIYKIRSDGSLTLMKGYDEED